MHDPMTVAHEIRYPWRKYKPWPKKYRERWPNDPSFAWGEMSDVEKNGRDRHWPEGYRESFITIWHVDPECNGDDDSCGFSRPHLTGSQRQRLWNFAWSEGRNPYFLREEAKEWQGTTNEAEAFQRALLLHVSELIRLPMEFGEAAKKAAMSIHHADCVPSSDKFCFLPGYHTNRTEATDRDRQERFYGILCGIATWILQERRPWYRHPRWHVWHWKIQCHPLGSFKRWAFSRCAGCGKRFPWGYAPVSGSWYGTGPRWFRREKDVWHSECSAKKQGPEAVDCKSTQRDGEQK